MSTEVLAVGTGAADSADVVITTTPMLLHLKPDTGVIIPQNLPAIAVQLKNTTNNTYVTIAALDGLTSFFLTPGAGTYRVHRNAGMPVSVGVDRD